MAHTNTRIKITLIFLCLAFISSAYAEDKDITGEPHDVTATEPTQTAIISSSGSLGEPEAELNKATPSISKQPSSVKPDKKTIAPPPNSLIDLIELEDHLNNKSYQQGYALAQKLLPHWEGDTTFDFLYGVHAIETGHYDEAIFAFERLTLLNPKTIRYRLELARALYFNNNLDTAKTEFEIALATNPPEKVKLNIQDFLNRINQSKEQTSHSWTIGAGINMGFDSNINSGTEEDGVVLPNFGYVSLQDEAQSLSSPFTQFTTHGIYSYSHKKNHSLNASINTSHKRNTEVSTYDLDVINFFGGYSWQPVRNIRLQGGLSNTNVSLDGSAYQNQSTISAMALYSTKSGFAVSGNLNFGHRSAKTSSAPDADISLYSATLIWPNHSQKSTNLSLYTGTDDVSNASLAHFGKDVFGVNFGTRLLITPSIVRTMMVSINNTVYQSADPSFLKVRKDVSAMAFWGYTWSASRHLSLTTNVSINHNASNLDLFTSYRAIVNTGINVSF